MERRTHGQRPLAIVLSGLAIACASDRGGDDDDEVGAGDTMTVTVGSSDGTTDPADDGSSAGDDESAATAASQETSADSAGESSAGDDASESSSDGGTGPTSGPGVLPGETGLEAFCRRYVECGGTYYAGEQECIDASYDYWGDCPSRAAALDAFGACMSEMECTDWSPDAYNPASTPCAEQWQDVGASEPCD